jgi:cytochrome b561
VLITRVSSVGGIIMSASVEVQPRQMSATDGRPAYTMTARALHWVTAALILLLLPLGWVIANELAGSWGDVFYDLHRSLGAALIPIVIARLIYRLAHPPLPLPEHIPVLHRRAAAATHWALYALLLAQPLTGWIATSAYPAPIPVFGLFELPPMWAADRTLSDRLFSLHGLIGIAIAILVAAHAAAACHHHFARRDRVLLRMITG